MKFLAVMMLFALLVAPTWVAASSAFITNRGAPSNSIEDYEMTGLVFEGTIGGISVKANGTAQQIIEQMKKDHPEVDFDEVIRNGSETMLAKYATLHKRDAGAIFCCPIQDQPWGYTSDTDVQTGVGYLGAFDGGCSVQARGCVQLTCWNGAGIYLCNNNWGFEQYDCGQLAQYALDIQGSCFQSSWDTGPQTCGQVFDTSGNPNVIVSQGQCGCYGSWPLGQWCPEWW